MAGVVSITVFNFAGPWFSQLGEDSIEDVKIVPLYVHFVDIFNQTATLLAKPPIKTRFYSENSDSGDNNMKKTMSKEFIAPITLRRRTALDQMQWCIKGCLDWYKSF